MSKPTISQVENAFQPAKEVDSATKFAGRKEAVQDAYYGLIAEGAHIAIVGNRGIGKTSLARQITNMSKGDNSLLVKIGLSHDRMMDFMPVYFACGKSISSTDELLERLLTSSNCLAEWIYDVPRASKIMTGYSPKAGAKLFGLELGMGAEKKTEATAERAMSSHSVDAVFMNVTAAIVESGVAHDGLLIVIDEFDQISDPSGFASFLKSISTNVPKVKFCIVGVAQDMHYLMKEHKSSDRLFAGTVIALPSMAKDELKEIVSIAMRSIENYIVFSDEAIDRVVVLAQGHPYLVHLIGKYALRAAFISEKREISASDIDETIQSIAERGADPVLEGRYKKAVASSSHREIVLKALARSRAEDGEVWTSNAYKLALDQGVDNASQYVGQLVTEEYGREIEKIRERYYRFHDSLFATYVDARPWLMPKTTD